MHKEEVDLDLKSLVKEFSQGWANIKSHLDQQADEMDSIHKAVSLLLEEKDKQNEVMKKLIDRQF